METNKKNTTPAETAASYFTEELPQILSDLQFDLLKIHAVALAASDAADNPGRLDPVSLAEIAADYALQLNIRIDTIEAGIKTNFAALK